ncbi:hypothetical protein [Brucella anthropi]|uniref:hypothetical protein n=1 Tax=Brucella anthropi TaxID=529 RepID=UPI00384C7425
MKTIALLAVGACMTAGTAFAAAPMNSNTDTQTVKSGKPTATIVASGKKKPGVSSGSTNRGLRSSFFGG